MRWGEMSRVLKGGSCGALAEGGRPRENCCGFDVGAGMAERIPGVAAAAAVRALC